MDISFITEFDFFSQTILRTLKIDYITYHGKDWKSVLNYSKYVRGFVPSGGFLLITLSTGTFIALDEARGTIIK